MSIIHDLTSCSWKRILDSFDSIVGKSAKGPGLVKLERWWLGLRSSTFGKDQLVKLIEWKGRRGKLRPALIRYAKDQDDKALRNASSQAFTILKENKSQCLDDKTLKSAMAPLLELRGIGPATAAAILAANDERVPFMGDEALEVLLGKREYTLKFYLKLVAELRALQKALVENETDGPSLSLRDMERVIFADALNRRNEEDDDDKRGGTKGRGLTQGKAKRTRTCDFVHP